MAPDMMRCVMHVRCRMDERYLPVILPLSVYLTKEEVTDQPYGSLYAPCSVCVNRDGTVPEELRETGTQTEKPAWKMIVDPKYSGYALTDRYMMNLMSSRFWFRSRH